MLQIFLNSFIEIDLKIKFYLFSMDKYIITANNILIVLGLYIIIAVFLSLNTNYQKIKLEKQMYIIKNVVKSLVLLYVGLFSSIDFIHL